MGVSHRTDWADSTVMICSSYGNGYRWLFITVLTPGEILQGPVCMGQLFWDVAPCSMVHIHPCFRVTCCFSKILISCICRSVCLCSSRSEDDRCSAGKKLRPSYETVRYITALTTAIYIEGQKNSIHKLTSYSFTSVLILSSKLVTGSRSGDRIPLKMRFSAARPHRPWGPPSLM